MTARTVAFLPEPGAWGPTNNCAAIAGVLRDRGHRVVFVVDESFAGVLEPRGFEERLFRMTPPEDPSAVAEDPWAEFIRVTAPEFRKPTVEQIATVTRPIWEALVEGEQYAHERLMAIWDEVRPDVVVTDNVCGYPAVELAGAPWVRVVSCNPLEMRDPDLPPPLSGLPVAERGGWQAFRDEYHAVHEDLIGRHNEFRVACGAVIYLSLGSLGCMDLGLMQRLIDALARTPHRVVVSLGPLEDQLRLGERMYGDAFLPQPSILPQCDLLITHAGNNTVCEGFAFGLPMIALPLFWDQYDNAQRLAETGFGVRLPAYDWSDGELVAAVDRLLADGGLRARMAAIAEGIRARPGHVLGADLIERLALTSPPRA